MNPDLELDGKIGGGSVIRVGIPIALALNKSLHVTDVRHNRKRRGLQEQHLSGLDLLQQLTGASYMGDHIGSTDLYVEPGQYKFDPSTLPLVRIPTAGAVSLVFQSLTNYVFASRNPAGFRFDGGGSHVQFSPNFDVLSHVNSPIFAKFGIQSAIQLDRPGFYPKGGARGVILLNPIDFETPVLEEGEMAGLDVIAVASNHYKSDGIAEKMVQGFKKTSSPTSEFAGYASADCKGAALSAILKYDTGLAKAVARVYQSSMDPIELGRTTAKAAKKIAYTGAAVDEQLADQLVVPLAFSPEGASYTFDQMYPHVKTNIAVVEEILGDVFQLEELEDIYRISRI